LGCEGGGAVVPTSHSSHLHIYMVVLVRRKHRQAQLLRGGSFGCAWNTWDRVRIIRVK